MPLASRDKTGIFYPQIEELPENIKEPNFTNTEAAAL